MEDDGELDWPAEMVQTTKTSPELTYSCNPLAFDFGMLTGKPRTQSTSAEAGAVAGVEVDGVEKRDGSTSRKEKKKKKKHRVKKKSRSSSKRHVSTCLVSQWLTSLLVVTREFCNVTACCVSGFVA